MIRTTSKVRGFTLIEMMLVLAIIALLATMLAPVVTQARHKARVTIAITDIRSLMQLIMIYEDDHRGIAPTNLLSVIDREVLDPWNGPYVYNHARSLDIGKLRYYEAGTPLNSVYDLFSEGPNHESDPWVASESSLDDVLRAADGRIIGKASDAIETISAAGL